MEISHTLRRPQPWPPIRVFALLSLLALAARLPYFDLPVQADEGCVFTWYCANVDRPVWHVMTHYPGPHNHVLHSILLTSLYVMTGFVFPWMRLPDLVAGVFCVPLTYHIYRRIIGERAATMAALMVCASGWMIRYSTDARGYTLATALGLAAVGSLHEAARTQRLKHLASAGLFSGLAIYTIPTLVYLPSGLCLWLAYDTATRRRPRWGRLYAHIGLFLPTAILSALILYTPILSYMGHDALWRYPGLAPLSVTATVARIPAALLGYVRAFAAGVLPIAMFIALLTMGGCRAIRFRRTVGALPAALLLSVVPLTLLARRVPPDRTLLFLLPHAYALAALGLVTLGSWTARRVPRVFAGRLVPTMAVMTILLFSVASLTSSWPFPMCGVDDMPDAAPIARFLSSHGLTDEFILARTGLSESLQYHLARLGRPWTRVGVPQPREHVTTGLLVRRREGGLGEKLSEAMRSMQVKDVVYEDAVFQVVRVMRAESRPAALNSLVSRD